MPIGIYVYSMDARDYCQYAQQRSAGDRSSAAMAMHQQRLEHSSINLWAIASTQTERLGACVGDVRSPFPNNNYRGFLMNYRLKGYPWKHVETYIRDKSGFDNLCMCKAEVVDGLTTEDSALKFTYCPKPPEIVRGKNKGTPNWKLVRDQMKEAVVTHKDLQEWLDEYCDRTGKCPECLGEKKVWTGWSVDTGSKYNPCPTCCSDESQTQMAIALS